MSEFTSPSAYGNAPPADAQPSEPPPLRVADHGVVVLAVVLAVTVSTGSLGWGLAAVVVVGIGARSVLLVGLAVLLVAVGSVRAGQAEASLAPDRLGPFEGWASIVDDPQPFPASTRVIFEIEGERFETWVRGRARQLRAREWRGGDRVLVNGRREQLDSRRAERVAWQHVVGAFDVEWASDVAVGGGVARASNRIRSAIERAGESLPADDGALYRGLVVGDDSDQPQAMIERFRASGLSHLTAVSGQNVAFVLAACGPLLRRLRAWPRLAVTVGLILWFVALTRFEPSIVRAGAMASLSAFAYATGRERSSIRILGLAVIGLLLVDPLLCRSIGFWLSVGATAGVTAAGPWVSERLVRIGVAEWCALPLGITLGAQLGVVVPAVVVFGRLPLVSIPANLLAVPVAGAVMLYGMPAGLLAGWFPILAPVLMAPIRVGTRWVDTVAILGARLEPPPPWPWVGWAAVVTMFGVVVAVAAWRGNTRQSNGDLPADR